MRRRASFGPGAAGVALAIAGTLAVASGCGGGSDEQQRDVSAADVREEAAEAVRAAADYAVAQRRELAGRAEDALDAIDRQVARARDDLGGLPEQTRERVERAIERAERARRALDDEIGSIRQAGRDTWDETQRRVADALEEAREARREIAAALAGRGGEEE